MLNALERSSLLNIFPGLEQVEGSALRKWLCLLLPSPMYLLVVPLSPCLLRLQANGPREVSKYLDSSKPGQRKLEWECFPRRMSESWGAKDGKSRTRIRTPETLRRAWFTEIWGASLERGAIGDRGSGESSKRVNTLAWKIWKKSHYRVILNIPLKFQNFIYHNQAYLKT